VLEGADGQKVVNLVPSALKLAAHTRRVAASGQKLDRHLEALAERRRILLTDRDHLSRERAPDFVAEPGRHRDWRRYSQAQIFRPTDKVREHFPDAARLDDHSLVGLDASAPQRQQLGRLLLLQRVAGLRVD